MQTTLTPHVADVPCGICDQPAVYVGYSNTCSMFQCDAGHGTAIPFDRPAAAPLSFSEQVGGGR